MFSLALRMGSLPTYASFSPTKFFAGFFFKGGSCWYQELEAWKNEMPGVMNLAKMRLMVGGDAAMKKALVSIER